MKSRPPLMNVLTSRLRLFLAALALNFFWLPTAPAAVWVTNSLMSTPRQYQTASLLPNGKVLVAGGCNASTAFASAELFDPATGSWSAATAMHSARYSHTATLLLSGKVLVAGGFVVFGGAVTNVAELYDPVSGTWTLTGSMTTAR
jgi:hypothetical protein